MRAAVAEPMIESELWVSFVSMLRAYAAAAEAHGGVPARVEMAEGALTLVAGRAALRVECNVATGSGTRTLLRNGTTLMQGSFQLLEDGRITQGEKAMDLDHAAIDMVAELTRAGKKA
ncbi:MAG TPA: hypothetical protein VME68_02545 [Acidobacteriaceae bacterium]|nr:hypothetical protein [Acidobacteriaceae bacterium]